MARIEILSGSRAGETIDLDPEQTHILGHSRFAGVRIKDPGVGRKHAQIEPSDGGFCVVDLGGRTGTVVNGDPLESKGARPLAPGDEITLGDVRVRFSTRARRIAPTVAQTVDVEVPAAVDEEASAFQPSVEVPVPSVGELESDSEADALEQEVATLKGKLAEISAKLAASGSEALHKELADEREAHVKTWVQLDAARAGLESARRDADAARDKADALRRELDAARDELDVARKECEEARSEAHELRDQLEEINEDLISISDERDRLADESGEVPSLKAH